jgi:hypothetical protein
MSLVHKKIELRAISCLNFTHDRPKSVPEPIIFFLIFSLIASLYLKVVHEFLMNHFMEIENPSINGKLCWEILF